MRLTPAGESLVGPPRELIRIASDLPELLAGTSRTAARPPGHCLSPPGRDRFGGDLDRGIPSSFPRRVRVRLKQSEHMREIAHLVASGSADVGFTTNHTVHAGGLNVREVAAQSMGGTAPSSAIRVTPRQRRRQSGSTACALPLFLRTPLPATPASS